MNHLNRSTYRNQRVRPEIETAIIKLMADGLSTKMIADKINLAPATTERYKILLLRKYNATNGTHLVSIAYRLGILNIPCAPKSMAWETIQLHKPWPSLETADQTGPNSNAYLKANQ